MESTGGKHGRPKYNYSQHTITAQSNVLAHTLGARRSLNKFGCNAMQWAAQTSRLDMCRFLVHHGLDATLCNNNGHSSLHKAAVKGQRKVCTWLIKEIGLSHQHMLADQDGNPPSEMARLEGHVELAQWLKEIETTNAQLEIERATSANTIATQVIEPAVSECFEFE